MGLLAYVMNWLKPEDSTDEQWTNHSLSGSYCISHVMNERLGKTERLETGELIQCRTYRMVRLRDWLRDSFFPSQIKDLFKNDPSLTSTTAK